MCSRDEGNADKSTGEKSDEPTLDFTRRGVMRAGGGLAAASFVGGTWFEDDEFDLSQVEEVEVTEQGLQYFEIDEARIVHDLTGRIYPSDENGPGAPEAGVVYFVDEQMNSAWGRGDRWYMELPFVGKNPTPAFDDEPENPEESVVNSYLQAWDAHNLFIPGASAFPHNSGYNPTGTVGALAFRAADGLKQYLEDPQLLDDRA